MGVRGLHSYIERNSDLLKTCWFRESKLIIDGSNLYYFLYFRSDLDQAHGGDYDGFEKIVTQFFKNLRICDIEPYVVLDGGTDVSDKKFDTLKTRCQERIRRANALSRGRSGEVLPILIKNVFKQILWKLGIPFIQCLAEADWEVAALASEWNCPVLSNDSDFYIFNIKRGFLPISHFQWRKLSLLKRSNKKIIPAKSYHVLNLCTAFNRMNKYNLSLFATILGNDYTNLDKSAFPNFSKFSTRPGGTAQIDGLLTWLSRFPSPKEAIAALLSPLGKNKKSASIRKEIYQGMAEYRLNPSSIAQFFLSGEPQRRPLGPLQKLPDWTLKPLAEGKLASTIIDILTLQRVMLNFQVEDFGLSSSSEPSRLIRQVTYGVLLCTRWQTVGKRSTSSGEKQQYNVEEYDRQGMTLTSSMVPAVLPRHVVTHLHLDSLWEAPENLRLQVVLHALRVSPLFNSFLIPANLQLAVYVTCFWLNHVQPEPKAEMFWALLIGLVYGHLCREHQTEIEAGMVISRLKNLQDRKGQKLLDLELAHAYCQWQCCLKISFNLNQLLNHPVPEPELAWLYSGSLVHTVAHELMRGVEPESLLTGASFAVELYRNLQAAVERELDDDFIVRMRMRAGPTSRSARCDPADELSKMFKHLMADEEEDDDGDKIYEETCSVRTRHVSRAHTEDPRAKKYELVKWC
ncbi:protein asteroid homolog 1-like [Pangasianodon hypophthalmus]|uniref:protein asteroid homolog 1-like n=1 Tax=Pangasianodon hypophthalmus TaxID=310915 RepID=UPI00147F8860|nr:protein asteroid homolog 1-like [Pangasianodon hypophthalmus]